jgi:myo-inositol-1-phosphate synthase
MSYRSSYTDWFGDRKYETIQTPDEDLERYRDEMERIEAVRNEREIETATDVYMQLQYLGSESLENLLHSVTAELERKGGFRTKETKSLALFAVNNVPVNKGDQ